MKCSRLQSKIDRKSLCCGKKKVGRETNREELFIVERRGQKGTKEGK